MFINAMATIVCIFMFTTILFATPAANAPCPVRSARQTSAERVVARFLSTYLRKSHEGLIDSRELRRIAPYLSSRLKSTFVATIKYQQDFIKQHPNEPGLHRGPAVIYKPPFVEGGDYFTSLFEWPDGVKPVGAGERCLDFRVTQINAGNAGYHVCVHFAYRTRPPVAWNDSYVVVTEDGHPVIDDVIYSGNSPYNRTGRLSELLAER